MYVLNKVTKSVIGNEKAEFLLVTKVFKEAIGLHNRNQLDEAKSIYK